MYERVNCFILSPYFSVHVLQQSMSLWILSTRKTFGHGHNQVFLRHWSLS